MPGATITRGFLPAFAGERAGDPSLCSVLHHMGFFVRLRLREARWALTPPFQPYPAPPLCHFDSSARYTNGAKVVLGGIFSVTLSVARNLHLGRPRFHEACCLPVFGLSSGKTGVKPAIARHSPQDSMERNRLPTVGRPCDKALIL